MRELGRLEMSENCCCIMTSRWWVLYLDSSEKDCSTSAPRTAPHTQERQNTDTKKTQNSSCAVQQATTAYVPQLNAAEVIVMDVGRAPGTQSYIGQAYIERPSMQCSIQLPASLILLPERRPVCTERNGRAAHLLQKRDLNSLCGPSSPWHPSTF